MTKYIFPSQYCPIGTSHSEPNKCVPQSICELQCLKLAKCVHWLFESGWSHSISFPLRLSSVLVERKKSHGARSGESLVCRVMVMLCLALSSHTNHINQALYHGGETKYPYSTIQIACLSKRSELMQIKFQTY
jgi:hypothetical protein